MDVLSGINSALTAAQKIKDLYEAVGNADFKIALAELREALADSKISAADLKEEIASLRTENSELKAKLEQRQAETPTKGQFGYTFDGAAAEYCTGCYDSAGKKILLQKVSGHFAVFGKAKCPVCDSYY